MAATTRRKSAGARREEILAIAVEHFAARGWGGTSTAAIAREAAISQPYLFRLFRTKKELFLAADERACETVLETFRRAAFAAPPGERLQEMERAYADELLPGRHAVLMCMQGFAAAGVDADIRATVRQRFGDVVMEVAELGGVEPRDVWAFFAHGMLLSLVAAAELPVCAPDDRQRTVSRARAGFAALPERSRARTSTR